MQPLQRGAERLGLELTAEQLALFDRYHALLVDANRRVNLTRVIGYEAVQVRHFLDSLSCLLAIGDLGVYAIHRAEHSVPSLWRFHAIHHSAEEMDWLVGFRFHPVDLLLVRVASLGPLVALHMTPAAIGIFIAVAGWQAWLVHANVRIAYGPLRWLLVSPEFHHWHHSTEREAFDKNFASVVACWDVVFGTVHLPRGRHPMHYGIEDRIPAGWVDRLFHPFRRNAAPIGIVEIADAQRP